MKDIKGDIKESHFLLELKKVSDLLEYDGPILSHFVDYNQKDYLFYWVDYNDTHNRWLVWRVSKDQISEYLSRQKTLKELLCSGENSYTYSVDIDIHLNYSNVVFTSVEDLPLSYLPEKESYFAFDPPKVYSDLLEEKSNGLYVDDLRKRSVLLNYAPISNMFQSVVPTATAAKFLTNFTNSFSSFAEYDFFLSFKSVYDAFAYQSNLRSALARVTPLIAYASFSSFEVGVSVDIAHAPSDDRKLNDWQKTLMGRYKSQVIDIDYNSDEEIEGIVKKYSEEERKRIFDPIIKIINDKDYKLTTYDNTRVIKKEFKKVKQGNVERIIPKKQKQDDQSQSKKFVNIIIEVEGGDISKLNKRDFQSGLLFSNEVSELDFRVNNVNVDGSDIHFNNPVIINLRIENNLYYAVVEDLNISESGYDRVALIESIERKIGVLVKAYFVGKGQLADYIVDFFNDSIENKGGI